MFNNTNMIQALSKSNRVNINVYLNTDDVHHTIDMVSHTQYLNALLSEAKTRAIGLRFLIVCLNKYPQNVPQNKANFWINIILRACNKKEINLYGELIYEALALLVRNFQNEADTSKWFGSTHLLKLYGTLSLITENSRMCCTISALKAIKECVKHYPGHSKAARNLVIQYLIGILDISNQDVVYLSGCCWLMLQQERTNANTAGNLHERMQWQNYQMGILNNLNILLNQVFPTYTNAYSTCSTSETHKFEYFMVKLHADPIERASQVCRRFSNLIEFLKIALSYPYPSNKLINSTKILHLVQRGLGLSYINCFGNTFLGYLLPHIHTKLIELLEVLVAICHTQLRMHFRLITEVLQVALKSTRGSTHDEYQQKFYSLRIKVYDAIILWLSIFVEGSGYDLMIDNLIENILEDITISQTKSKLITKNNGTEGMYVNTNKALVCRQALRCLQTVLVSFGYLLKPSLLKDLFNTLLEIAVGIFENSTILQHPYNDWLCRLEIYKSLFTFTKLRNLPYPPPMEIYLHILNESYTKDPCLKLRTISKHMIKSIETILHSQKESLIFQLHVENMPNVKFQLFKRQSNGDIEKNISHEETIESSESKIIISNNEICTDFIPTQKMHKSREIIFENQHNIDCHNELHLVELFNSNQHIKTPSNQKSKDSYDGESFNICESKCDDDQYIAELEAAFVDELI
ncbi:proline-, glutamic acid- and leucine-rich protein 1 isoform X1 [Drosophila sulfurigaster albostrigata]|uniref:proline-, glutamic acid- and leucine-rich protein 1 isoform X1 n=2 Tax=Drosophila sulfurigaster albostrigata TaxID=89887 RepID=UPI002D21BADF|nr:proline-, glutamic acid- and leucine-rich protein 1 isoform X1 [Drosophila sulfurigaster albostrigata]XP_062124056.1 proline-, glutamic acid- and leucine-rich protein 1 isoform X1 [Drosophila sulfurigaster albostrigata]